MTTPRFDTLRYVDSLIAAGVAPDAAKANATALNEALEQAVDTSLATKQDIARIEYELRLHRWMHATTMGLLIALLVRSFF